MIAIRRISGAKSRGGTSDARHNTVASRRAIHQPRGSVSAVAHADSNTDSVRIWRRSRRPDAPMARRTAILRSYEACCPRME